MKIDKFANVCLCVYSIVLSVGCRDRNYNGSESTGSYPYHHELCNCFCIFVTSVRKGLGKGFG